MLCHLRIPARHRNDCTQAPVLRPDLEPCPSFGRIAGLIRRSQEPHEPR